MEDLSQYDYELHYIKGEENTVADTLSCHSDFDSSLENISLVQEELESTIIQIFVDYKLFVQIQNSYNLDNFCHKLCSNLGSMAGAYKDYRLLYLNDCLVIPSTGNICEDLYHFVYNELGHFGTDKTYLTLCNLYY